MLPESWPEKCLRPHRAPATAEHWSKHGFFPCLRTAPITLGNFSLSLTSPGGNSRQMMVGYSAPSMAGPYGPPLLQIQVKPQERYTWVFAFVQFDQGVQSLSQRTGKALQSSPAFQQVGPQLGANYLSPELNAELLASSQDNWFWEAGTTTIRLVCNDENGRRYEISAGITLSGKQVEALRRIREHYKSGYGLIVGAQLAPVGSAQPSHQVKLNPG